MTTEKPKREWRITPQTVGDCVYDPIEFLHYSNEKAVSTRMYGDDPDISLVIWNLEPGQENSVHVHPNTGQAFLILTGQGEYVPGEDTPVPVRKGQVVIIPRNQYHGIRNTGTERLSYLAVTSQAGGHNTIRPGGGSVGGE